MTRSSPEQFSIDLKTLAERLARCEQVRRFDTATEKEAWTLAHSFLDLAASFDHFLSDQLPRLRDESLSCEQVQDLLIEIGEEFRHILYHVRDPEYFAYLREVPSDGD